MPGLMTQSQRTARGTGASASVYSDRSARLETFATSFAFKKERKSQALLSSAARANVTLVVRTLITVEGSLSCVFNGDFDAPGVQTAAKTASICSSVLLIRAPAQCRDF